MATTYLHVTVDGAGAKDGAAWASAMDMATFRDHLQDTVIADTIYYVKSGTYTLGETMTCKNVAAAATPVRVIGVLTATTNEGANVVVSDYAYTANRPVFALATYAFTTGSYYILRNLQFTNTSNTAVHLVTLGSYSIAINCKATNIDLTAGATAAFYNSASYANLINCEAVCTNGYGILMTTACVFWNCYIHDSAYGIYLSSLSLIACSIVDTCSISGIRIADEVLTRILNNTIYNCAIGISGTTGYTVLVANNIISQCADGVIFSSEQSSNIWLNNIMNNTDNEDNQAQAITGSNIVVAVGTTVLNDPANGDFRLKSGDMTCRNVGAVLSANDGLSQNLGHQNSGADQTGDFPSTSNVKTGDTVDGVSGSYLGLHNLSAMDGGMRG